MKNQKTTARIAGILYLAVAVTGMFSLMYVPSQLIVNGDASTTAENIARSPLLYHAGIVSGLVCQTTFIFLGLVLYHLLKHINKFQAIAMLAFVTIGVAIVFLNAATQYVTLDLLTNTGYKNLFTREQIDVQVMIFLNLYQKGILVAEIFWGLWLFPLGYLAFRSQMFPKIFGILLMTGCFAYLFRFAVVNFLPNHDYLTIPGDVISAMAEISFLTYLLVKGVKGQSTDIRVSTI